MSIIKQSLTDFMTEVLKLRAPQRRIAIDSLHTLQDAEPEYKRFCDLADFPEYALHLISKPDSHNGNHYCASAGYEEKSKEYYIVIPTYRNISKATVFHEFTHLLDMCVYAGARTAPARGFDRTLPD